MNQDLIKALLAIQKMQGGGTFQNYSISNNLGFNPAYQPPQYNNALSLSNYMTPYQTPQTEIGQNGFRYNPTLLQTTSSSTGQYIDPSNDSFNVENADIYSDPEQLRRMAQNQFTNTTTNNYDENGNAINTDPTQVNTTTNRSLWNPYTGVNLESALFSLGQSLNYEGDNKAANTFRGLSSAGKVLFGGSRTLLSGAGFQNRQNDVRQGFNETLYAPEQFTYMQEGGEITNAQVLTGAYLPDMGEGLVEVERNEQIKNSQTGAIQKAVGDTHENGGIKTTLPDGSKVLSDHTKIGAKNAKMFRNEFDLKVKATDTYAAIMDKYNKSIGFTKTVEEETKIIEKIGDQQQSSIEDETKDINMNYLAEELQEKQIEKEALKSTQDAAFEKIFAAQEKMPKKGKEDKMQEGGQYDENIQALAEQYGIAPERIMELLGSNNPQVSQAQQLLQQGAPQEQILQQLLDSGLSEQDAQQILVQATPQMQAGGTIDNLYTPNPYMLATYGNQSFGSANYLAGNVGTPEEAQQRIQSMQSLYPNLISTSGLATEVNPTNIGAFQTGYNAYADSYNVAVDANPILTAQQKQQLKDRVAQERFIQEQGNIRNTDNVLGNFTSSRGTFSVPILTTEERQQYPNLKFLGDAVNTDGTIKPEYADLTPDTQSYLTTTFKQAGAPSLDVGLAEIPVVDAVTAPANAEQARSVEQTQNVMDIARMPVDFILPPSPMQDVYKPSVSLTRIEPVKVSVEPNLIEADRQRQSATNSVSFLPDNQRAAVIASLLGQTQQTTNQAITAATVANAQAQTQADTYNAQVADKQQLLDAQFSQDYEAKAFSAQLNTERDLRNYFTTNNLQQRQNYADTRDLNLLNQLYPQFQTNGQQVFFNNAPLNLQAPIATSATSNFNYGNLTVEQRKVFDREIAKLAAKNTNAK